jgi:hypothetical protein
MAFPPIVRIQFKKAWPPNPGKNHPGRESRWPTEGSMQTAADASKLAVTSGSQLVARRAVSAAQPAVLSDEMADYAALIRPAVLICPTGRALKNPVKRR